MINIRNELNKEISELRGKPGTVKLDDKYDRSTKSSINVETQRRVSPSQAEAAEVYLIDVHGENVKVTHPMYFLNFAKQFDDLSDSTWETNKMTLLKYMKGAANIWMRGVVMDLKTFEEFEYAFKSKYWGRKYRKAL